MHRRTILAATALGLGVLIAAALPFVSGDPAQPPGIAAAVPGARPIPYAAIRDATGVLGYAESMLGLDLATVSSQRVGPGTSAVDPSAVLGAWELPPGTRADDLARSLGAHGRLIEPRSYRQGQLWLADYAPKTGVPLRLLLIDGTNPTFSRTAAPEVRPGPHIYLIAYRAP